MAHFAQVEQVGDKQVVVQVVVVDNAHEQRGQEFLAEDLGLGGTWIQCSYNGNIRRNYPGPGYLYLPEPDIFIPPSLYPSWTLDANYDWQPPVQKPEGNYHWDEDTLSWIQFVPPTAP